MVQREEPSESEVMCFRSRRTGQRGGSFAVRRLLALDSQLVVQVQLADCLT